MKAFRRVRPSPAMVIACIALAIALGGTSYAAVALAPNSVGTAQLKNGAVTAKKVRLHTLLSSNFRPGEIPAGPPGPAGATGPAGPAGPAGSANVKWAVVRPDGGIAAQSGGITLVAKIGAGQYLLGFGSSVAGKPILASGAYASDASDQRGETSAGPCGGSSDGRVCITPYNSSSNVFVETRNSANSPSDHAFYVAVLG